MYHCTRYKCGLSTHIRNILTRLLCTLEESVFFHPAREQRENVPLSAKRAFFTSQKVRTGSLSGSSTSASALVSHGQTSASFCHLLTRLHRSLLLLLPLSCICVIKVFQCNLSLREKKNTKQCVSFIQLVRFVNLTLNKSKEMCY